MNEEMLAYARETQHEKIIRSLAVGIALTECGNMQAAEPMISILVKDKVGSSPSGTDARMLSSAMEACTLSVLPMSGLEATMQ
jgi:hypothetical protein